MNPKIQKIAESFAERHAPKGYTGHNIRMCQVCGHMEWSSSTNDRVGVVIDPMDRWDRVCQRCAEAYSRAPEVVLWVMEVVGLAKLLNESG